MPELLLEILSEEIPARMQARAAADLKRLVCDGLKEAGLEFTSAEAYATPRRLALVVDGLPAETPDVQGERKGPKVDAPEQAMEGFKRSLPEGAVIEERETPKGNVLFATWEEKGQSTATLLADKLPKALAALPWPKSMRWATHDQRWVRPIQSMASVFDGKIIAMSLGPVVAGSHTVGHRFLAPGDITIDGFSDYKDKLRAAKVLLDPAERRESILSESTRLCDEAGLVLKDDPGLLDEVTGLVEWPVVYMGSIDEEFMDVPPEVLTTSMRSHQKYFSVLDKDGNLAPKFIVVANTETSDGGAAVIAGNERVLRARLSDAKFFWDQDRKQTLESRVDALKDRVFHAKLGSVHDKVERFSQLAAGIAEFVPGADADAVTHAARLAKADLSTGMVSEFPDLQGVIGRYYASHDGEDDSIANAIADHYSPLGPNDDCPTEAIGICVALADKIDSIVGFFAIDEKPTGSKDPFALRRAALGVIRLVIENELRMPLAEIFSRAHGLVGTGDDPSKDLLAFFADRLKVHLREKGVKHDHIDAVFGAGGEDDLVRLLARVDALSEFLASEDGENLLTAYRRAANILKIEEKKDGRCYDEEPDRALLQQDEEIVLAQALGAGISGIEMSLKDERWADAMGVLAALRKPVDDFFDAVTVNADDPAIRENRLKLLSGIRSALDGVADFSRIEG